MNGSNARVAWFLLIAWLTFRFVSDFPRGLTGSGIGVEEWMRNLSYAGLVPFIALATLLMFSIGKFYAVLAIDPIARAHLLFIVFQTIGLFVISRDFGNEGLVAGIYILLATLGFLYVYILSAYVTEYERTGEPGQRHWASRSLIVWVLMPSLAIAAVQLLTGNGRIMDGVNRIYGGTSSPNVLSAILLVAIGLQIWSGTERQSNFQRFMLGLSLVLFVGCFSMSGFVCLAFMFAVYGALSGLHSGRLAIRPSWVLAGLVGMALLLYFAESVLLARFAELENDDNSLTWRTRTWAEYAPFFKDLEFILIGGGLGFDHLGLKEEPHNEWLRMLLEVGVFGVILCLRIFFVQVRGMREILSLPDPGLQRRALGIIAITAALLLWSLVDSVLRTAPSAMLLWVATGLLVGTARREYRTSKRLFAMQSRTSAA